MGRPGAKDDAKDADRLAYYRFVHGAVRRADAPSNQRNKWKIVKITLTHISARPNINCKMTFRVRGCARAPDCESGREKGARPGRVVRAGRPIVVFFAVFGTVDVAESISRCWGWFWVKDGARWDDVLWWAVIADKMSPDCFRLDFFFFFFLFAVLRSWLSMFAVWKGDVTIDDRLTPVLEWLLNWTLPDLLMFTMSWECKISVRL